MKALLSKSSLYGTNAERLAMNLGGEDREIEFYETDTGYIYHWKGSEWIFVSDGGSARVTQSTLQAGEDITGDVQKVETRGTPAVISTATTTLIKTGPGNVNSVRVAGGVLGNVAIYDGTDATGTVLLPAVTPVQGQVLLDDIRFSTGLTIVTLTATILTVSYR